MSLYHWTWAKNVISCHIIASHSNDWCIVTCMQIRVPIWSYFYHQVEIIIWAFAPCIARIVHWKLWLVSPPKQKLCGIMSIVQNKKCRNCKLLTFVGFCVFLRIICVLLRFFCVRFVCGLEHVGINTLQCLQYDGKVACIFVIRGRSVGPCLNSGADEQEQYILCCKKNAKHVGVSNSWNRIYWPDTQRSSTGNLNYPCLNDNQKFLRHLISERLIQMCQSGMFTRFAHCLRRFAFKVS